MYNSIISNNITKVNILGKLSPADGDRATLGNDPSTDRRPPFGDSLPIFMYSYLEGGNECAKPYHVNLEGDRLESETLNLLSEDSVLQFINRHISAFDYCESKNDETKILKRDKLADTYLEFLNSHKSFSTCDIEYYVGIFVSFIKAGADIEHACRFLSCGTQISTLECESCGYQHSVPYNCKLRICERCGAIRASELVKKHQPYLETLDPRRVRCITLTMKNVVCLKSGVSKIRRCYIKLLHRKYYKEGEWHKWQNRKDEIVSPEIKGSRREGRIEGSLYHIEATIAETIFGMSICTLS